MWEEETAVCAAQGCSLPQAPASPPRHPTALCPAVDAVRAQFHSLNAVQHAALAQQHETLAFTPAGGSSHGTPAANMSSPHAQLLRASPAANNVAASAMAAPAATPAVGEQGGDVGDGGQVAWQALQEGLRASQTVEEALLHASQTTDDDGLLHVLAQAAASQPQGGLSRWAHFIPLFFWIFDSPTDSCVSMFCAGPQSNPLSSTLPPLSHPPPTQSAAGTARGAGPGGLGVAG